MRCAFFIALALCLAVGGARRAQMETGAQATESSLSSLYSLRRGHTHKKHSHLLSKQLPRFAEEKADGVFSDAAGAAAKAAGAAVKKAKPMPKIMPMVQDPVDFPPKGVGSPPKDGNKARVFVPFGKAIPRKPGTTYYTASGAQECSICKYITANHVYVGVAFYELCNGMWPEYMPMCHAQQKTLQGCPEFTQGWCYQDLGGSQVLRSPCPDHLTCHYCLGVNPLHCIPQ